MYYEGKGVTQNYEKALDWFEKAKTPKQLLQGLFEEVII